jgi:hypothetical protein
MYFAKRCGLFGECLIGRKRQYMNKQLEATFGENALGDVKTCHLPPINFSNVSTEAR